MQKIDAQFALAAPEQLAIGDVPDALLTPFQSGPLRALRPQPKTFVTGAVYNTSRRLVVRSQRLGGLSNDHVLAADLAEVPSPRPRSTHRLKGTWYYGGHWMNHFGDFLTETLTSLWYEGEVRGIVFHPFVFGAEILEWQARAVHLLGLSADCFVIVQDRPVAVENLVTAARPYVANGFARPEALAVWERMVAAARERVPFAAGPVFISRARHHQKLADAGWLPKRAAHNDHELDELFVSSGFRVLHPESVPFEEQIAAVADAGLVIGNSGSGLHLAAFAGPGTTVVELGDARKWTQSNRNQAIIGAVRGHELWFLPFPGGGREYRLDFVKKGLRPVVELCPAPPVNAPARIS